MSRISPCPWKHSWCVGPELSKGRQCLGCEQGLPGPTPATPIEPGPSTAIEGSDPGDEQGERIPI